MKCKLGFSKLWFVGGVGLALYGCAGSNGGTTRPNYGQVEASTTTQIQSLVTQGFAPGVIVEVTAPGLKWSRAFGYANLSTEAPMTVETPFRIASLTKTFTTSLILSLVDKGALQLSDTYTQYAANQNYVSTGGVPITVQEIGSMASGVPDYIGTAAFQEAFSTNPAANCTLTQMLGYVQGDALTSIPGTSYSYSNTNGTLLGCAAVGASGAAGSGDTETLFESQLLSFISSLNLSHTQFDSAVLADLPSNLAHGYAGTTDVTSSNTTSYPFAANMISTVDDLSVWMRAVGKPGLLSQNALTLRSQWLPLTGNSDPNNHYAFGGRYAYGWFGHNGRVRGFNSAAYYNASIDATIVVVVNTSDYEPTGTTALRSDQLLRLLSANFFPANPLSTQGDE